MTAFKYTVIGFLIVSCLASLLAPLGCYSGHESIAVGGLDGSRCIGGRCLPGGQTREAGVLVMFGFLLLLMVMSLIHRGFVRWSRQS